MGGVRFGWKSPRLNSIGFLPEFLKAIKPNTWHLPAGKSWVHGKFPMPMFGIDTIPALSGTNLRFKTGCVRPKSPYGIPYGLDWTFRLGLPINRANSIAPKKFFRKNGKQEHEYLDNPMFAIFDERDRMVQIEEILAKASSGQHRIRIMNGKALDTRHRESAMGYQMD